MTLFQAEPSKLHRLPDNFNCISTFGPTIQTTWFDGFRVVQQLEKTAVYLEAGIERQDRKEKDDTNVFARTELSFQAQTPCVHRYPAKRSRGKERENGQWQQLSRRASQHIIRSAVRIIGPLGRRQRYFCKRSRRSVWARNESNGDAWQRFPKQRHVARC